MRRGGFTIVELLIVIVVIAILAAIAVASFNRIQDRARATKINSDIAMLKKALMAARINTDKTLTAITGSTGSASGCVNKADGTNLATLAKSDV